MILYRLCYQGLTCYEISSSNPVQRLITISVIAYISVGIICLIYSLSSYLPTLPTAKTVKLVFRLSLLEDAAFINDNYYNCLMIMLLSEGWGFYSNSFHAHSSKQKSDYEPTVFLARCDQCMMQLPVQLWSQWRVVLLAAPEDMMNWSLIM